MFLSGHTLNHKIASFITFYSGFINKLHTDKLTPCGNDRKKWAAVGDDGGGGQQSTTEKTMQSYEITSIEYTSTSGANDMENYADDNFEDDDDDDDGVVKYRSNDQIDCDDNGGVVVK